MNKNSVFNPRKNAQKLPEGEGKRKQGAVMGVDASKSILSCAIVTETELLFEKDFNNTLDSIGKIINVVKKYQVESTAFEATNTYHFKLMFAMDEAGLATLLANPQQTKNTQGKKTDKLDARRIAIAHRDGRLLPSVITPREIMQLRRSTRTLQRLKSDQTKSKQRLNQLFHLYDFTLRTDVDTLLTAQWSLNLLFEISATKLHDKMIIQKVKELYPGLKTGKKSVSDRKVIAIIRKLTIFNNQLDDYDRLALNTEISQLRFFASMIERQRQTYLDFANNHEEFRRQMEILISIKGVGPDTAASTLAEIVDISLFQKSSKLAKWTGLAPKVNQSGHRKKKTGKIHKGGNKYLRRTLTTAVQYIYARGDINHPIYQFVKSQYEKDGQYWRSICAGARKLATIIWVLLTKHDRWQPPTVNDEKVLNDLNTKIERKIQALERKISQLHVAKQNLSHVIRQELNLYYSGPKDANKAIKILLQVT